MAESLRGKNVLLTGVSRGVGRASARLLLEEGARLLGIGRDETRLAEATQELTELSSGSFHPLCLDVSKAEAPQVVAKRVEETFGHLDIAIFNAGVMLHHADGILSEPDGVLENTLATNLFAPFKMAKALLPLLEKSTEPRIINVGSGAGTFELMTDDGIASYRLSKWALHGLTLLEAKELQGKISVNAFDPGWIKTDLGGPKAPGTPEEAARGLLATISLPLDQSGKFFKDGHEIPW